MMSLSPDLQELAQFAVERLSDESAKRIASMEPNEIPLLFKNELADPKTMDALQREIHRLCTARTSVRAA